MVDTAKLKATISERGLTVEKVSAAIGMDDSTFYRKMNAQGRTFTVEQVDAMKQVLGLDRKTAEDIFFS